ncbi:PREDICTED: uncharacterized protein LOC103323837 [Prunus mume]|uniref:Uncharacterized protein LOC103323837 n=1 Tax=Prunus mume TaxID=102107 RepID=A0ABM0NFM5_PRUMU|nr:PREDICTED: uncharacterized protein LOC103323837 [Prunus mume]
MTDTETSEGIGGGVDVETTIFDGSTEKLDEVDNLTKIKELFLRLDPDILKSLKCLKSLCVTISESSAKLKHFIFEGFDVPSRSIIDAYTPNPKYLKNFDTLSGSKLFLFLSGLDISEAHIKLIKHVNERIEKEKMDVYKTVWIPIAGENKWKAHEEEDKYLLHIAERLSCYAARPHPECIRNIEDMFELHKKKNYLVLLEMDQRGHVEEYNPAKTIVKERMARFGFKTEK